MTDASPFDASDPAAVKRKVKASRQADRNTAEITRGLMSLPAGRAWMFSRLEACHVFRTTYTGDSLSMAFKEGERNVGLQLLSDVMAACPDQFLLMMREANERSGDYRSSNGNGYDEPDSGGDRDPGYADDN